jgi:hypothetical protein
MSSAAEREHPHPLPRRRHGRFAGTLTYGAFGNLKIEIRADQGSSEGLRTAGIGITDGVISSDGRTVMDVANRTLTNVVASQPAGTGALALDRPRHWEVQGTCSR